MAEGTGKVSGLIAAEEIEQARERIAGRVVRTPLVRSPALTDMCGVPVHLKLEHRQTTGSFKLRGATNAVLSLGEQERARGVVGVSTGNHGRGLAYAAKAAGVRCIICMSELVPGNKVAGIEALGAEVRIVGRSQDDAQVEVDRLVREAGMTMLPPFDHRAVIAGQGTLGLEILEDLPALDTVLVPLSGGGLISGLALAVKSARPEVRVIGISMERGAAMRDCQKAGKPIPVEEMTTLADSLGGGIGLENRYTFAMVRELVDDIVTLSESEIAEGIRHAYWREQEVIEGSGAVGIGALLAGKVQAEGPLVALVSGRNIDMALHHKVISGEEPDIYGET
ncbi:hydroxyectoine utilization dehydratase EutB [Pelagibius sp. Alg239-R121]|uniref:hydroxyectoine utilization dehydratase EutB n=1 Tax=Pelagibius sp. Alg239-R121 TaxID=2993448 RepID=UPI0024A6160C|nr:hydroxyectoine utilization dehydratase EutB [Pelagibius sp. Alg239-R121]